MTLFTRREAKLYLHRRLAADDLSDVELRSIVGLLKLSRSGFWQNSFCTQLICDYDLGNRTTPQQVVLLLADCIDAIESVAPGSAIHRKLIGKRPEKAPPVISDQADLEVLP